MMTPRAAVFDYESLPLLGKLSLRISTRLITAHLKPGTWLDFLCGYQSLLQFSQRQNHRIRAFYSFDHKLDPELARHSFILTEGHVDTTLAYQDQFFDNVTIVNGLEHLWYPEEILSECHRILKPGGVLQVVVPTWFGKPFLEFLAFRIKNAQAYVEMNDHKLYYDERTLWPMLVRAGFQPKDIRMKRIKMYCSLYARATKTEPDPPPVRRSR